MAAFPPIRDFTTQLLPNEHLLRGGFLKRAVIIDAEVKDNRAYIKLCMDNTTLRSFFSGQATKRSHIQRRLFALLAELRDQKQDEWNHNATPSVAQEDAVLESLGGEMQDDVPARAPAARQLPPSVKKALRKQFPFVVIDFPFGDESVGMRLKSVATRSEQPSVEFSDENFRVLFCWCQSEAAQTEGEPPTPKVAARFEPRDADQGREYFRKDRMCYYLLRDEKWQAASSDSSSPIPRSEVCIRRTLGRPRKQARVADVSDPPSLHGVSNSELDGSAGSESTDDPNTGF